MAYTPINWQTGDTITAEKLNRCDNGWAVESSSQTYFTETVTTVDEDGTAWGDFSYSTYIVAETTTITFDGTDYVCTRQQGDNTTSAYGGYSEGALDFTDYPFAFFSDQGANYIATSTGGTHTVSVAGTSSSIETSALFETAVNSVVNEPSTVPMKCATMVTTYQEMLAARDAGRLMYIYLSRKNCVLINSVPDDQSGFVGYYPLTTGISLTFDNDGILQAIQ